MDRKPKLDEQHVIDELTAVCNSLGKVDENDGTYMKDRDCKACLREILRYLNADSDKHVARIILGDLNVVKSDLIPLLVQYCDYNEGDPDLFGTILRLCTNLTTSSVILMQNRQLSNEPECLQLQNKLQYCLYGYKAAFAANDEIWSTLNTHLRHNNEDEVTFERLIILIRNILHIPVDSTLDMGCHNYDDDVHIMCLYRMEKSGMLNTLIEIASESQKGAEFCFHITEIVYLMLRDQNPEALAKARQTRYKKKLEEDDVDKKLLRELSAKDKRAKAERGERFTLNFRNTGRFVVQNVRSLSHEPLIVSRPIRSRESISFDRYKTDQRKAKNKKPASSETSMIYSDKNARLSRASYGLRGFCKNFVDKIYNDYMQQLKHNLIQKRAQANDETYYLWAVHFFISFVRHLRLSVDLISETLSSSTLHYIQMLISSYQDQIETEKKNYQDLSKRLHLALRAYRAILHLISSVDSESQYAQKVATIRKTIFNESEYSLILLNLFQHYQESKHSQHYLKDLIETNEIFLELHESTVSTTDFVTRYCCPDIISCYMTILKNFETNEDSTNLAILRLFERIVSSGREVALFQTSVFSCLIKIVELEKIEYHARFKSLCEHLIRSFGLMANKKRWMYQELLFWKRASDVVEIENAVDPPPDIKPEGAEGDDVPVENQVDDVNQLPPDTLAQLMAELDDDSFDIEAEPLPEPEEVLNNDDASKQGDESNHYSPLAEPDEPLPELDTSEESLSKLNEEVHSHNLTSDEHPTDKLDHHETPITQPNEAVAGGDTLEDLLEELRDDSPILE